MDDTKCFALQTEAGKQVGFMLGASSFQGDAGDCVFMLLASEGELVDSPLGIVVAGLKVTGEHRWERIGGNLLVRRDDETALEITDSALVLDGAGTVIGKAVAVAAKR
jgi:hypothetical protein